MALFSFLRTRLSVDKPGKLQHIFELFYEFVHASSEEMMEHGADKYIPFFGTIFLFIFCMNTLGPHSRLRRAHHVSLRTHGHGACRFSSSITPPASKRNGFGYIKQFLGPVWWLMPLLFPIEIASHAARPLSLTLRLYANMFAGEQVSDAFTALTKLAIPVIFIALHAFACILQSYIFMMLAMVYIGGAVSHEH